MSQNCWNLADFDVIEQKNFVSVTIFLIKTRFGFTPKISPDLNQKVEMFFATYSIKSVIL
jgi:hypothetical protein